MSVAYVPLEGVGELALSLKPPKWLRNSVGSLLKGNKVSATVATPAGPVVVDASKESVQRVQDLITNAVRNTTITVGPREAAATPVDQARDFVETKVPGGWLTVGAGALALFAIARMAAKRG